VTREAIAAIDAFTETVGRYLTCGDVIEV